MARGEIRLIELTKRFADVTAVDSVDLEIPGGEFFSLLGPSGWVRAAFGRTDPAGRR
jgi:spermidine/putrescine transport system ATP-binding protein